jgi:serine/threonine protein phosphatase 1
MTFLRRLVGSGRTTGAPHVPPGHRIYAVGDVHGRDDLLAQLLAQIEDDHARHGKARLVIVFLGDLIDRGAWSRDVVERLRNYRPEGARLVFLCGNHEEVLLRILDGDAGLIPDWLKFGGGECLQSYGVDPAKLKKARPAEALRAVRSAIPPSHVTFLRGFDDTFRAGDYLFVHAGIRPGVPLDEQGRADLRWIREPFLGDRAEHGFVVVHGHSVREVVEVHHNRIGIDTGAYRFGVLTALALEGEERRFLQATGGPTSQRGGGTVRANSSALDGVSGQSG